jgi:uncharacterized protein
MITQKEILDYLKSNKLQFSLQYDVVKIGIFGSYARNEQNENSDIDVIIDMPRGTDNIFEKRMALKETISQHFSKPVDICHERAIKDVFRKLILKDVIYV